MWCAALSVALNNRHAPLVLLMIVMPGFAPGSSKLIHDKLFGQEYINMVLLPCTAAVLAAAGAVLGCCST